MSFDTFFIAAVLAFFGSFAVTLFSVSVWVALDPAARTAATRSPVPARRPDGALNPLHEPTS